GPGDIVINGAIRVELDADETAELPLEAEVASIDDVDARVRAIGQVVLGAMRVDPADVVRPQRIARDLNRSQAFGFSVARRAWAHASAERGAGCRERHGAQQHRGG